ncbi:MAG: hypothetical protein R2697_11680 [Ilumatobacteraceae bacterium]
MAARRPEHVRQVPINPMAPDGRMVAEPWSAPGPATVSETPMSPTSVATDGAVTDGAATDGGRRQRDHR